MKPITRNGAQLLLQPAPLPYLEKHGSREARQDISQGSSEDIRFNLRRASKRSYRSQKLNIQILENGWQWERNVRKTSAGNQKKITELLDPENILQSSVPAEMPMVDFCNEMDVLLTQVASRQNVERFQALRKK